MTRLQSMLPFALIVALAGCGGFQKGAEEAVRQSLKDPDSARFGEFYYNSKTGKGCLTVNAKNSMGGYTGDQQAYVQHGDGGWIALNVSEGSVDTCRQIFADSVS